MESIPFISSEFVSVVLAVIVFFLRFLKQAIGNSIIVLARDIIERRFCVVRELETVHGLVSIKESFTCIIKML